MLLGESINYFSIHFFPPKLDSPSFYFFIAKMLVEG